VRRADLLRVASRVSAALGPDDCVLVGGMAVAAHGFVRATRDVDFVAKPDLAEARKRLSHGGIRTSLHRGDPLEGGFPSLQGTLDGVRVDVLPPLVPIDWERAIEVTVGKRSRLRVVDLEGLLHLKLRAGGPRDLMDVAVLLRRHPGETDRTLELAQAYRLSAELGRWLRDPRLKAEIEARARRRRR
jgi:hypothetical protein